MIRILLADDQALVRAGFRALLDAQDDMKVVGEAVDGDDAVRLVTSLIPDVVLMDIRMPRCDGLEATWRIVADERLAQVKIIILTTFDLDEYIFEALRAGASGFLVKDTEPIDLIRGIQAVARGDGLLSPSVTRRLIAEFATLTSKTEPVPDLEALTEREREVMALVAGGLSNGTTTTPRLPATICSDAYFWQRAKTMHMKRTFALIPAALAAAALFGGLVHVVLVVAHVSEPAATTVYGLTPQRLWATTVAGLALVGVLIGGLALARPASRFGTASGRLGAIVALVAGLIAVVNGGLVLATATGGPNSGNGVVGGAGADRNGPRWTGSGPIPPRRPKPSADARSKKLRSEP